MLNRVVLIGRTTKDGDLRYTPSGVAVYSNTIACDRPGKEKETDFIPIVAWQKLAETCGNYVKKGKLIAVEGRLQVRNYENNEGKRVFVTEVVADNVRFLPDGKENSKPEEGQTTRSVEEMTYDIVSGLRNAKLKNQDPFADDGKPINISDDDLPF